MGFTIDIDTGGTFTDGFFTGRGQYQTAKVDTTPHDLTVCLFQCIAEGASEFGFVSVEDFLRETEVVRFSTTVGTNSLVQRTGPKIGLLVSAGHQQDLYQEEDGIDPLFTLIPRDMVAPLTAELDAEGRVVTELQAEQIKSSVKFLLEQGARIIVVSLKNSHLNPQHENQVKAMIEQDYPKHYLGAIPIILASQICRRPQESLRTSTAVMNAYLHRDMVKYLYKADDGLRAQGAGRPLLIAHGTGGTARVAKTKALDTYNSGPVAGLLGSQFIAGQLYNLQNVVTFDVGGTTTDIGLIYNGGHEYNLGPEIENIKVAVPLIKVNSLGVAGGSIAGVQDGELKVGPESAGAMPGPVCYNLGQIEPTVTDACLALGHIDPENFLGGRRKLDLQGAKRSVEEFVAVPLNTSLVDAALKIKEKAEQLTASAIYSTLAEKGHDPKDFVLFSFGGAGGLFCCGVAERLNIQKIYTFPFSSVFSAFGSSTLDVMHSYEEMVQLALRPGGEPDGQGKVFNAVVENLKKRLDRDMRGEGFSDEIGYTLELEIEGQSFQGQQVLRVSVLKLETNKDVAAIIEEYQAAAGGLAGEDLHISAMRLKATAGVPHYSFVEFEGDSSENSPKGSRNVFWASGFQDTPIYERLQLSGQAVYGPAVIETDDSTYVIPQNWSYRIDRYGNGIIMKEEC